jgi:GlcNAc-P-P-Und epimerase
MSTRWLITGGSGFIGTNYINYLRNNHIENIINIDKNPPLDPQQTKFWVKGNILNKDDLLNTFHDYKPTFVLHLAARADCDGSTLSDYIENTIGTEYVISAIKSTQSIKHSVFTSTQYVYQPGDNQPRNDEDYSPHTEYGQSKVLNEIAIRNADLITPYSIIRPTNIWGPWHLRYRDQFLRVLYKGLYGHPGGDLVLKSYGYVGNVVDQIYKIFTSDTEKMNGKVIYVGDEPINLLEWVNAFSMRVHGRKVHIIPYRIMFYLSKLGDGLIKIGIRSPLTSSRFDSMTTNYFTPMDNTFKLLGESKYSLDEAVDSTIKWLESPESECNYWRNIRK